YTTAISTPSAILDALQEPPVETHLLQNTLWPEINKLYGHGFELQSVTTSPSGKYIASCSRATKAEHAVIRIWNAMSWKQVAELKGHTLTVTRLRFSPDEKVLVSVGRDRGWWCWDVQDEFKVVKCCEKAHSRIVWDVSITHDSRFFATGSRDKSIKVWVVEGESIQPICVNKFEDSVTTLDFAPRFINAD
ncbi:Elongator subunit elp2, partial [Nowakowskiella sp. JEL0078]